MSPPGPLYVFTARFNPMGWQQPHRHYVDWAHHLHDLGAQVVVAEVVYGEQVFRCDIPGVVTHHGYRADSWAWSKENLLNLAIRAHPEARYICWSDSDVFPRRKDWVDATLDALQHYRIVQPWADCYDLGPDGEHLEQWRSFSYQYVHGFPIHPGEGKDFNKFWKTGGGEIHYPHPGYSWAMQRSTFDAIGGLFEHAGMGAADHHQAVALLGMVTKSFPKDHVTPTYRKMLETWEGLAKSAVNGRIGYVAGTLEHRFHGLKGNRRYWDRWQMFLRHGFDPITDLRRNAWGVIEFTGNKPQLELEWDQYLRQRYEDENTVPQVFYTPGTGQPSFQQQVPGARPPEKPVAAPSAPTPPKPAASPAATEQSALPPFHTYPEPFPAAVIITPPLASLPDTAKAGQVVAQVHVEMSDGSTYTGTPEIFGGRPPSPTLRWQSGKLTLARDLRSTDRGQEVFLIIARGKNALHSAFGIFHLHVTHHHGPRPHGGSGE